MASIFRKNAPQIYESIEVEAKLNPHKVASKDLFHAHSKTINPKRRGRLQRGLGGKQQSTRYPNKALKRYLKTAAVPRGNVLSQSKAILNASSRRRTLGRIAQTEMSEADKAVQATRALGRVSKTLRGVGALSAALDIPNTVRMLKQLQRRKKNLEEFGRPEGGEI